ncbi:MAG: hypothetical protein HUJ25_06480 [Crocinitomicaceae bacterium]|nr:hypothetical protein [Crocinitomicaceae bacterium]
MSKRTKILIISGVVILLVLLLYFFGRSTPEKKKDSVYVTDSWTKTYHPTDRSPYGTFMMKELLDTVGLFGNFIQLYDGIKDDLEDHPRVNDIYFFIGPTNYMPDSSAQYLLEFVESGNTAFIAAHDFPTEIGYNLFYNSYDILEEDAVIDSVQYFKFEHPDLSTKRYKFKYIYENKAEKEEWHSFDQTNFDLPDDEEPVVLGTNNTGEEWNYVKLKYGKGYFFLHTVPYCFTNISMMKRDGFMYAERVLEHIPPGRVQWDRYNLKKHVKYTPGGPKSSMSGGERRRSALEFIMAHPPLIWALLLLVTGAIFYVLFKGKRMQKVIPAAELKENTSLEYVNTLSSLYMQQGSHSKLIKLKEKTFLNFIAERYYIITKKADEKFIEKVAIKSQVEKDKIGEIFEIFDQLNGAVEVSDDDLILLHKKIEYFYKKCR